MRPYPRRSLRWWRDLAELCALALFLAPPLALVASALRWLGWPIAGWP